MSLWIDWKANEPDDKFVVEAKERINQYSRQDWITMSGEATEIMNDLVELVRENVDIEDIRNRQVLEKLSNHLRDWFFVPDMEYFAKFSGSLLLFGRYKDFFNQFYPGTSTHLLNIIDRYSQEVSDSFAV
jgi:hypothetical protein